MLNNQNEQKSGFANSFVSLNNIHAKPCEVVNIE